MEAFTYIDWKINIFDIIYSILTGTAFYHLWFFVLIIQLYALYPIIERIFSKFVEENKIILLLFILLMIQILLQILSINEIPLIGTIMLFLGYTFYFVLGMYARSIHLNFTNIEKKFKYSHILFLILIFATVWGAGSSYIDYFVKNSLSFTLIYNFVYAIETPVYYVSIFILCLYIALKISEMNQNVFTKLLTIIGNFSFGIYLIHAFILVILTSIVFPKIGLDINNPLFFPVAFSLVLILSLLP